MNYIFVSYLSTYTVIWADDQTVFSGKVEGKDGLRIESNDLTKEELEEIFNPEKKVYFEKIKERETLLDELDENFSVIDNKVIVTGIPVGVPELLVKEYKKASELKKEALLNFWKLAVLNPDTNARDGLFRYVSESGTFLTRSGYLLAYRGVKVIKQVDRELFQFIDKEYLKIKRWKKNPSNYGVFKATDGSYKLFNPVALPNKQYEDYISIGNLSQLYKNREGSETIYSWQYNSKGTGLTTNEICIGTPFTMKREMCDPDPHRDCSSGLHFTSWKNLYSYIVGDVILAILVNPMHIVAVPFGYEGKKARCCEYLPIAEVTEELTELEEVLEFGYQEYTLGQINDMLKNTKLADGKELYSLNDLPEYYSIIEVSLEEREKALKDRYHVVHDDSIDDGGGGYYGDVGYLYDDEDDFSYDDVL